jgi:FAD/FMN-containing dehydrogenase
MSVQKAIEEVSKTRPDMSILPHNPLYTTILSSYFSELNRDLEPDYFIVPDSTTDVAEIVNALKRFSYEGLKVAICGSGQQATPGVANIDSEITIHLRNLRGIEVDREKGIVSIAAGEQMGNVYEKLVPMGLACSGNRHSSGGIGGDALQGVSIQPLEKKFSNLISLGGLSYFSYNRGFICDDVVNYEIVLASGEIVQANAETNKDLWVALKGGGCNFGIVTRFDLRVFEQGPM